MFCGRSAPAPYHRHVERLLRADAGCGAFRAYALYTSWRDQAKRRYQYRPIYVHAKVAIVDEPIALHFLWFTVRSLPVSVAILGGAVLGALLSLGVSLPSRVRHRLTVRTLKGQVARHEARLTQLTATGTAPDGQRTVPERTVPARRE